MFNPKRLAAKLRRFKPNHRLKSLFLLLCSLLAGLLPLLIWACLILLWYYSPLQFSADISKLTLALFCLSPFAAGFAGCRWRPQSRNLGVGAWPAFLLWLAAALCYAWLFGLPKPEKAAISLIICLLLGIAGAMSAARVSKIRCRKPAPPVQAE